MDEGILLPGKDTYKEVDGKGRFEGWGHQLPVGKEVTKLQLD